MTDSRTWTRSGLAELGFTGFEPFENLVDLAPRGAGVYVVLRPSDGAPSFLELSAAGWRNGRDPSASLTALEAAWVQGSTVVYIGKATSLRSRLSQYRRHGLGGSPNHWGGRYVWQLADRDELIVGWKETPGDDPGDVEAELITAFVNRFGARPFANRVLGRARHIRGQASRAAD